MSVGIARPGAQAWPSRFDSVQWNKGRPRPNQLHIEYRQQSDILDWLCQGVPRVAIVGTREPTIWGRQITRQIVHAIRAWDIPVVIVSGVCDGIDQVAHETALECSLPTIGVLPLIGFSKLRTLQERIIARGGMMLSEFPHNTPFSGNLYLLRDGITTALADVVIPIQAHKPGGTYATINRALAQHKPVWAPTPPLPEREAFPSMFAGIDTHGERIRWFNLINEDLEELHTLLHQHLLLECP